MFKVQNSILQRDGCSNTSNTILSFLPSMLYIQNIILLFVDRFLFAQLYVLANYWHVSLQLTSRPVFGLTSTSQQPVYVITQVNVVSGISNQENIMSTDQHQTLPQTQLILKFFLLQHQPQPAIDGVSVRYLRFILPVATQQFSDILHRCDFANGQVDKKYKTLPYVTQKRDKNTIELSPMDLILSVSFLESVCLVFSVQQWFLFYLSMSATSLTVSNTLTLDNPT